jgi:hypothetical protein
MASNYSTSVSVDTTGKQILQFEVEEIDSLILTPDADILIGFSDLSQAVFPVSMGSAYTISHLDFRNQTLERIYGTIRKYLYKQPENVMTGQKIITLFAKGTIGNANIAISFLGGNR